MCGFAQIGVWFEYAAVGRGVVVILCFHASGILYTIRRAGSQREETVPEAKIPPHCCEWN